MLKILDYNYVMKNTPDPKSLKVQLKKDKMKGVGLFARKNIKKGEVIAYYRFKLFSTKNFKSKLNNMYTITVYTKDDNASRALIGDLVPESLLEPVKGIPYWAYFSNEPTFGKQHENCYIDIDLKGNYKNKSRLQAGDFMVYKLRASEDIPAGKEIVWCYGSEFFRDYVPGCTDL
uniref:SET domain-containing protein n=1 Tax=viral metagenome TaxID=1070528 RepID=A0A6C0JRB8_9ZZZZ